LIFHLEKKDENASFWPRLLKTKEKNQYLQVDWGKWVDEDEEEEDPQKGLGGVDPSQMQSTLFFIKTLEVLIPRKWAEWAEWEVWEVWEVWEEWVECKK